MKGALTPREETPVSLADRPSEGNREALPTAYRPKSFRLRELDLTSLGRGLAPQIGTRLPVSTAREGYNAESMTEDIKKKLRDELNILEHELAFDIPKEIKKAVAMGDLSENAEYHMAKQRQEYLKARVRQLGKRLADLSLVNMNNIPKDKVGLGSTVTIFDSTKNEEMRYELVASEQSDVAAGRISTTSPIGRALLNKKVGDTATVVTPGGSREMEILKLSTMHDLAEAKLEAELDAVPEAERETE